jgi:hypothetical protein
MSHGWRLLESPFSAVKGPSFDRTGLKLVLEGRFETSAPLHMGSGEEARDYLSAVGLEAGRVKTLFFFSTP